MTQANGKVIRKAKSENSAHHHGSNPCPCSLTAQGLRLARWWMGAGDNDSLDIDVGDDGPIHTAIAVAVRRSTRDLSAANAKIDSCTGAKSAVATTTVGSSAATSTTAASASSVAAASASSSVPAASSSSSAGPSSLQDARWSVMLADLPEDTSPQDRAEAEQAVAAAMAAEDYEDLETRAEAALAEAEAAAAEAGEESDEEDQEESEPAGLAALEVPPAEPAVALAAPSTLSAKAQGKRPFNPRQPATVQPTATVQPAPAAVQPAAAAVQPAAAAVQPSAVNTLTLNFSAGFMHWPCVQLCARQRMARAAVIEEIRAVPQ